MLLEFADLMAYELATRLLQDFLETAQAATATSQVPGSVKLQETLAAGLQRLNNRETLVRAGVAKRADAIRHYRQLLSLREVQSYPLAAPGLGTGS